MIEIDLTLRPEDLVPAMDRMWQSSARSLDLIAARRTPAQGAPVFTVGGEYTAQGWTEWTQGFQFGSELLQFDVTEETRFLDRGRQGTWQLMAPHVSNMGVHDHGFNNISTYGALRRFMLEGRIDENSAELAFYEMALKASGAVQAARWSRTHAGGGYLYSFNGPHSLFADTLRSLRALALAHLLGHRLNAENDEAVSLLGRLIQHARTTADFNVYYGENRDLYDVRGRVAHESIFNINDGRYRCPSSQQGYAPFTTWTRGAAWIITGYAEQLEFLELIPDQELDPWGGRQEIEGWMLHTVQSACDYYLSETPTDGIPYWDTGAPGLVHLGDYRQRPADPFNDHEPVDSSAAAIAAQGFLRLGRYLDQRTSNGNVYTQAGLTILRTLLAEPYLNTDPKHEGLLLHAIYHRPRNWDYVPQGSKIPCGEACMWGDYHLRECALLVHRLTGNAPYYTFFGPVPGSN